MTPLAVAGARPQFSAGFNAAVGKAIEEEGTAPASSGHTKDGTFI